MKFNIGCQFVERKGEGIHMVPSITIYRGTHQIGGCVTEIEAGDERIIIDFGANLPGNKAVNVMLDKEIE